MNTQQQTNRNHILSYEEYHEKLKKLKDVNDVSTFAKELIAPVLQEMLEAEMTNHLGYEKHATKGDNSGNSRNGYSQKKIKTNFGQTDIDMPRDRNGEFEPQAVKKYQTTTSDVEEKIISMYAKGMTTRDINQHMNDIYGIDISAGMVSAITDKVIPLVHEWQERPLSRLYLICYLDGIHFKVRDQGRIVNKCGYTILGLTIEGKKELLGIWIGESEGAKFWMSVLNEIKNRGVEDILVCCIDGLSGFQEAIQSVFPKTDIQQCIVHQIRNTIKYVPHKLKKAFCDDLKKIYTASSEESGRAALEEMKEEWPAYTLHLKKWEDHWSELSTFFVYSPEIRKILYTTNAVESLHRQMRKVTKTTSVFPTNESLKKLLWLGQRDFTRYWDIPVQNWGMIVSQFAIMYPDRVKL